MAIKDVQTQNMHSAGFFNRVKLLNGRVERSNQIKHFDLDANDFVILGTGFSHFNF